MRVHTSGPVTAVLTHWARGSDAGVTLAAHVALGLTRETCAPLPAASLGPAAELFLLDVRTPQKPGADVGFVGKAHAGQPVQAITARLGVFGEGGSIDRSLRVVGDRADKTASPVAFTEMPITWQRTWAGEQRENPVGVPSTSSRPANVFEQARPQDPASFAPVPYNFPARLGLLAASDRSIVDALEAPDARGIRIDERFPIAFFHWAPPSQRLAQITGTEEIILENLVRDMPRFRTSLPALDVRARVRGGFVGPRDEELVLACDALLVDGEEGVIHLLFRTPWATPRGVSLMGLNVEIAAGYAGHPLAFTERTSHPIFHTEPSSDAPGATRALSPEEAQHLLASRAAPVPFPDAVRAPLPPLGAEEERTLLPSEALALSESVGGMDTEPPPPEYLPPELRPGANVDIDDEESASTVAISPETAEALLASRKGTPRPIPAEPVRTAGNTLVIEMADLKAPDKKP